MKKQYFTILVGSFLFLSSTCLADEGMLSGSVDLGGMSADNDNSAKFQEYRDLDDNLLGKLQASYQNKAYHTDFLANKIGLEDQAYMLHGGRYGLFKYTFLYDETPHNYTFDAKSPYTGIGSNNLTYTGGAVQADDTLWAKLDYSIVRKKYGGELLYNLADRYYFKVGAERMEAEGVRPLMLSNGFTERAELPEPIDQSTDQLSLSTGYAGDKYSFEVFGLISYFENNNKYMNWQDPNSASTFVAGLAPDNDYQKYGLKFTWRDLPLASFLALNASHGKTESSFSTTDLNLAADTRNAAMLASLNRTTFDGKKKDIDLNAALTSRPMADLNTRLYFRYSDTDNDSSVISYTSTNETNADRLFDYSKRSLGIEAGYKLPKKTKLTVGYDFTEINRQKRPEFSGNTDHTYSIGVKNNLFEHFTTKIKYQHLNRNADTDEGTNVAISDFSANEKTLDQMKLGVEIYPSDTFDVGLDLSMTKNNYDLPQLSNGSVRGRSNDDSTALYVDLLWRLPNAFSLNGFAGFENKKVESLHNNGGTAFMQDTDSDLWTYGLTGKRPFMDEKINVSLSWEYQQSDGESNFGLDASLLNIERVADYTKQVLEAKADYTYSEKLSFLFSALYERYTFSDLQYDSYTFNTGVSNTYLSGAYADPGYNATVGYVMMKYGF